ncbi:S8 family serine peptidase [Parafilimonas sp.]|uniref:S8 family serine peptidase n=1 Tax=Parafilimonas sp. TaxID=1969739 RepID=UPI0039E68A5B
MKQTTSASRFILLPASQAVAANNPNPEIKNFLLRLNNNVRSSGRGAVKLGVRNAPKAKASTINLKVIDSINEDGAKLVEMKEDEMAKFRFSYPGLRIIPEKFYRKPPLPFEEVVKLKKNQQRITFNITIRGNDGNPLPDVYVVAFSDFANRTGDGGNTNSNGKIKLTLAGSKVERLYVYPPHSYWGYYKSNFTNTESLAIKLISIDTAFTDSLRHFYDTPNWPVINTQIRVGVIDTGVGPHTDLIVSGGANTIEGEDESDFADNGEGHGTHVAGIIAANGGVKGVAAGAQIYSYRVFPKEGDASNFYIMKAIKKAVEDGCDLINMSLGEPDLDEGLVSSIKDAYSKGVLCFAANGNDDRSPVSFPASYSLCVAVSAMGRKGTFPRNTVQKSIVKKPFGKDPKNFIADFSNIGPETDVTAPGVGIISTFPNNLYAIMDGTSMACPAATGLAARLLSTRPDLLNLPGTQQRADEMLKFLSVHIQSLGFDATFEGKGMLSYNP